jgi:uncharacterized protein YaiL (DUF2058 family)
MQNLRDKLLKAGLVSEKQASEAERDTRAPKKGQTHRQREETVSTEEKQRREAFAAREAEQAEERRKEAAKKAEARQQSERALRLRQLVESNRIVAPGAGLFHYVRRNGKIGRLAIDGETQKLLESGAAAVVEDPGAPDCAIVPAKAAEAIYSVDPKAIRFWHGPEKPIGFSDAGEE